MPQICWHCTHPSSAPSPSSALPLQSLQERHTPETEEYDISSVVYRARRPFHPARLHDFLTTHFVLQEPDWSEALAEEAEAEHSHALCNGHHHHHSGSDTQQQQQGLSGTVQQAVLHASQAAAQAATALQAVVQQQTGATGGSSAEQQALLATVAAATSAAAAASSAAAILLSQLQAGSAAAQAASLPTPQQQQQQQQHHDHHHAHGPHAHQQYRQHGPPVSAAEAASRQARLTAECGQLCRSKGFVWLATRPDLCGEWSQAGGIVRLGVGGPWYAALPDEAWPQEEEARAAIRKDFQEPHGDRRWGVAARGGGLGGREHSCWHVAALQCCWLASWWMAVVSLLTHEQRLTRIPSPTAPAHHCRQELVLIGVRINGEALTAALDACLCTEAEMEAAAAGQLADPFLQWPSLQQILDAGDDDEEEDEEDGETERASRLSTVEEGEEEAVPAPGSVHDVAYGAAELQEAFDAAAARLAQPGGPPALGVVSWHAAWCEPCGTAAAALRQLAAAHPGAAFFTLDVEGSAANTTFALEKVMRKPESRRAGGWAGWAVARSAWPGKVCVQEEQLTPGYLQQPALAAD